MLIMWYYIFLWTHLLCLAQSMECDQDRQYKWPISNPTMCCKKCKRGQFMKSRCNGRYDTQCAPCQNGYYMDFYNNELQCRICSRCTKNYMMYKENCTTTSDAVCGCKNGYELHDMECKQILTTTAAPTTNTKTTQQQTPPPTRDTHLRVDGSYQQLTVFGLTRRAGQDQASVQKGKKYRCQSKRQTLSNFKKKSERDGRVRREEGRRLHMRVWIEYGLYDLQTA